MSRYQVRVHGFLPEIKLRSTSIKKKEQRKNDYSHLTYKMKLLETTLSNPILDHEIQTIANGLTRIQKGEVKRTERRSRIMRDTQMVYSSISKYPSMPIRIHDSADNPWLWSLELSPRPGVVPGEQTFRVASRASIAVLNSVSTTLQERVGVEDGQGSLFRELSVVASRASRLNPEDLKYYQASNTWNTIVSIGAEMARTDKYHGKLVQIQGTSACFVFPGYLILEHQGEWVLLSWDLILMFKDLTTSRFIVEWSGKLNRPLQRSARHLANWVLVCKHALQQYGNDGYLLIKYLEALAKTRIIQLSEDVLDPDENYRFMLQKVRGKQEELTILPSCQSPLDWVGLMDKFLQSIVTPSELSEIFGFLKLSGHPHVDPDAGVLSAAEIGCRKSTITFKDARMLEHSFCHIFLRGYILKMSKWPRMTFQPKNGKRTRLEELSLIDYRDLPLALTLYPPEDWEYAQFEKCIEFDYGDDILALISDRSLSYKRTEFDAAWYGDLPYLPPKPTSHKRVLTELISRPSFDLREIIDTVSKREVPEDWKIITVYPKEREMKIKPRMFSMMPLEMRTYFAAIERNVSKGLFRFIPEQSMTMSRQELLEQFLRMSKSGKAYTKVFIEVDFSRWNLVWRKRNVHPIGRRINAIYGTPGLFDYTHEFFSESLCNLRLQGLPPPGLTAENRLNPPTSSRVWTGHEGGFEGISQKPWTACTTAMIHSALWGLGIPYRVLGQGDNQIVELQVFKNQGEDNMNYHDRVRNLTHMAKDCLAEAADKQGHEVKPEECSESTNFFSYGKEMWLNGATLPQSLKYLSRIFPAHTPDAPSLSEYLGTVSSGGSAASDRSTQPLGCFTTTLFFNSLTLTREFQYSNLYGTEFRRLFGITGSCDPNLPSLVGLYLSVPVNLGGLLPFSLLDYIHRGHSDPLTSSLIWSSLCSKIPIVGQYLHWLTDGRLSPDSPNQGSLVSDPYSIPLFGSGVASSVVASQVRKILPKLVQNRDFIPLVQSTTPEEESELLTHLVSYRPVYPKIIHDLFKKSPIGLLNTFSRRFTNTRTLISIVSHGNEPLSEVALAADQRWIRAASLRFQTVMASGHASWNWSSGKCYQTALTLRKLWKLGDIEGVTTAHPLDLVRIFASHGDQSLCTAPDESIIYFCIPSSPVPDFIGTRGPRPAYLGSATQEKRSEKWARPSDSSPPLRDALHLLSMRDLISKENSPAWNFITDIAQSRLDFPTSVIEPLVPKKIGGTTPHRFNSTDAEKGVYTNTSPNASSWITMSSNRAGRFSSQDLPFMFNEAFFLGLWILTNWNPVGRSGPVILILHLDPSPLDEVRDQMIHSDLPPPHLHSIPGSYYSTAREVRLATNAMTSNLLVRPSVDLPEANPEQAISGALRTLGREWIRSAHGSTEIRGKIQVDVGLTSLIDQPEVSRISLDVLINSCAQALIDVSAYRICHVITKTHSWRTSVQDIMSPSAFNLGRVVFSTSRSCLSGTIGQHLNLKGSFGPGSTEACTLILGGVILRSALSLLDSNQPSIFFLDYIPSLDSYLDSAIYRTLLYLCPRDGSNSSGFIRLVKWTDKLLEQLTQDSFRAKFLLLQVLSSKLLPCFRPEVPIYGYQSTPLATLRMLRQIPVVVGPRIALAAVAFIPWTSTRCCRGTNRLINYNQPGIPMEDLIESWWRRPNSQVTLSDYRWKPLQSLSRNWRNVLVVGIGAGTICQSLQPHVRVTGLDTLQMSSQLGHDVVSYLPNLPSSMEFSWHTLSWKTNGDIYNPAVQRQLLIELTAGMYDAVLIDIESGSVHDRLRLRERLSVHNIPVYCRILLHPDDSDLLISSVCSLSAPGDMIWRTYAYSYEYVVGGGSFPLGLFQASHSIPHHVPTCPCDPPDVSLIPILNRMLNVRHGACWVGGVRFLVNVLDDWDEISLYISQQELHSLLLSHRQRLSLVFKLSHLNSYLRITQHES